MRLRPGLPDIAAPHPSADAIERIAALLASAERPVIMFGKGAAWSGAGAALSALVSLGLPFIASPMGRGTVPDDDPHNAGGARSKCMREADAVLMVGGRFNCERVPRMTAPFQKPEEIFSSETGSRTEHLGT